MPPKTMAKGKIEKSAKQVKASIAWTKKMLADKQSRRALAKAEFRKADKDNSNSLDKKEVLQVIADVAHMEHLDLPSEDKILALFTLCDKNGDGVLQEGEFMTFFKTVLESYLHHAEAEAAQHEHVIKEVGGAKNGKTRTIMINQDPKMYPADDIDPLTSCGKSGKRNHSREAKSGATAKLRKSITKGTVLILLAGRFRGRRVVFLKQMSSGLLLVSGPYGINGIPLRRVNQAYCIATSTKVDVSKANVKAIEDGYFGKAKVSNSQKKKKGEEMFEEAASTEISAEKKKAQADVDGAIKCDAVMSKYLKASFSLQKNDVPHKMIF